MSGSSHAPGQEFALDDIQDNTEVRITVTALAKPKSGYNFSIDYYPKRRGDTKIYHTATAAYATPGRPRQVLWYVDNLQPGQAILIEPKTTVASSKLPLPSYSIHSPNNAVLSGGAKQHPAAGVDDLWQYSIRLVDTAGTDLADPIDPMVVIETDP